MAPSEIATMAQAALSTLEEATTAIALNLENLQQLNSLVSSVETLVQTGYVVKKLTENELKKKMRCTTCGIRISKKIRHRQQKPQSAKAQQPKVEGGHAAEPEVEVRAKADDARPKPLRCNFHPGEVVFKVWTCCGKHVTADPCFGKEEHDAPDDPDGTIKQRYQFYHTTPEALPSHRVAVAIDCEMGTAYDGDTELIRLTVIDYFTGETLIDHLVYPDIAMRHFNTRYSGVTRGDMEKSRRKGKCFMGRDAAREAVFFYVGPETIVVGHAAQNDLSSLRWIHHRVVDSHIVEFAKRKEAEKKAEKEAKLKAEKEVELEADQANKKSEGDKPREGGPDNKQAEKRGKHHPDGMSLKALAMKHLGRAIQEGKGHDSLEDALAARDLIRAYVAGLDSR